MLGEVPVWRPVLARDLGASATVSGSGDDDRARRMRTVEERATLLGLPAIRWPEPWPGDTETAMLAAIFAQQAGRVVAFSLAAFRQAFAGGRDLAETDNVLIAAAACELHPRAVLKAIESRATADRLRVATAEAASRGVGSLPAVAAGGALHSGEDGIEQAAAVLGAGPPR